MGVFRNKTQRRGLSLSPGGKPIRLGDVAMRADVSISTVSRVINGGDYVSHSTRRRVEEAIRMLDYHPNRIARSLKTSRTTLVGVIIPEIRDVALTSIARRLEQNLRKAGYRMILCLSNDDPALERDAFDFLAEHRVRGIVHVPATQDPSPIQRLTAEGIAVVQIVRQSAPGEADAVLGNNLESAALGTAHLISHGHRRIGILCGPSETTTGQERAAGYRRALVDAGLPFDADLLRVGRYDRTAGARLTAELLDLAIPPTALFAADNELAVGLLLTVQSRGLRIPHDLSVITYDDAVWCSFSQPPMTTVDQAPEETADLASQLLLSRMRGGPDGTRRPVTYRVGSVFVERQSCAAPPSAGGRYGKE